MRKNKNKKKGKFSWLSGRGTLVSFLLLAIVGTAGLFIGVKFKKYEYATIKIPTAMEIRIGRLVAGQPMAEMTPFIAEKDKAVAAYLVAIAKKESNWGKFSPQKNNKNCYNYWGYRGTYNQTASGYSCFDSPQQAVTWWGKESAIWWRKMSIRPKLWCWLGNAVGIVRDMIQGASPSGLVM